MNSADWSAVSAVIGAAVAVAGTVVAVWSARIARAAAQSARDSAAAAVEQTRLLRRQAEAESAARDEAAGPRFSISAAGGAEVGTCPPSGGNESFVPIAKDSRPDISTWLRRWRVSIVMTDGPPEVSIRVAVANNEPDRYRVIGGGPHYMVPHSARQFTVVGPYQPLDLQIELVIHSDEPDGRRRSWVSRQSVEL